MKVLPSRCLSSVRASGASGNHRLSLVCTFRSILYAGGFRSGISQVLRYENAEFTVSMVCSFLSVDFRAVEIPESLEHIH